MRHWVLVVAVMGCAGRAPASALPLQVRDELPDGVGRTVGDHRLSLGVWSGGYSAVALVPAPRVEARGVPEPMPTYAPIPLRVSLYESGPLEPEARRRFWANSRLIHRLPDGRVEVVDELLRLQRAPNHSEDPRHNLLVIVEDHFDFAALGDHTLTWNTPVGDLSMTIRSLNELDYLTYRFVHDHAMNDWHLTQYAPGRIGGLAERLVRHGRAALERLAAFLDDESGFMVEGSWTSTAHFNKQHRRCDYAAMMIAEILEREIPELAASSREERDAGIARVRDAL